ncbi:tetratricopeptide repeat protein [Sunxiuqinia sp. A32]|uniref:tetratricopeptide repeat protein n=1 Tax=Sunxiuqinia sp. A32 TaxID=3461496 RepID=UPI004045ECA2
MKIRNWTYFLLLGIVLNACVTSKPVVEQAVKAEPEISETKLSEEQEKEFEYLFIEGVKQKKLGKQQNAVSLFSRCLEIDPNSAAAMYELAGMHYANKDLTSASLLLEKAIQINSENKWYKLMYAQILQQRKQYVEAASIFKQLSDLDPDNLEYLYSLAVMYSMGEQYAEAIDAYERLEKKTGLSEQISVAKQQVYVSWGKPEKAFEEIHQLIESDPNEPQYYGLLAELYQSQGDQENALKNYKKILEIDPNNGFVHFSLASYYIENGDKKVAFDHIKKAFASEELDADAKIQYYMMQTADKENAEWTDDQINELLEILHETHPDDNRLYTIFAEHLLSQQKLEEARDYLRKYLETDQSNYIIWQQMLFISNDLLDFESLYTDTKSAIELFPNQPVLYALHAVACIQLDKNQEAIDILTEGEPYLLDNQQMKIQYELYKAEANYKIGKVQEAFKAFDEVVKLDPENYMAMNNYAYYLSIRGENLDKAERMSGRVVQQNPDNPTYLDTYAWVLFKRKDYQLALFYIESAINKGGQDNPVLIEHHGDILFMLGKKEEALKEWKQAQSLGSESTVLDQKILESRFIEEKEGL